ncbi:MAG: RNA 3'-terminal-phosphate cyclase [Candidatus Dadabacteria bacterium RIFCSPHIGHO2_12_FULL_53_21]|nr:MAG: RNA 3'-terminal-phosphate cyclase [Candidatus Dadabacteria bacterium RIFCSPHIGHO2_12_FULL_53_21]
MNRNKEISIDGSYGEGGGQIVRTACALSAITGVPCRIYNIRKNRKNPGLGHQHVLGLRALARLCGGTLSGDRQGSTEITLAAGGLGASSLDVEIMTAGSITLLLQTLLLPAFLSRGTVRISFHGGATDTFFSPVIDYHRFVFSNILARIGLKSATEITRRGFYPRGGAEVGVEVTPGSVSNWRCTERGRLRKILILSGAADILKARRVAERQAEAAEKALGFGPGTQVESIVEYFPSLSAGSTITVVGDFENTAIGSDSLGRPGKRAEAVGEEAALAFIKEFNSGACLDAHATDQVLPYLSLAEGESLFNTSRISKHTATNIWVIGQFIDRRIDLDPRGAGTFIRIS